MPCKQLSEFLDKNLIWYRSIPHAVAYTAPEIAASAHIPGKQLAKTVILKVDGQLSMLIEPSSYHVNLRRLQDMIKAKSIELASESEFRDRFIDCEIGAMPPFGNLYGMPVYVDRKLAEDGIIAFNAGSHAELLEMRYEDFARLVQPQILNLH